MPVPVPVPVPVSDLIRLAAVCNVAEQLAASNSVEFISLEITLISLLVLLVRVA